MDRFDLENQINGLLNTCEDIDLLTDNILNEELSTDEIVNVLIGISGLIKLKHNQLFNTMKVLFKLDEYSPDQAFI